MRIRENVSLEYFELSIHTDLALWVFLGEENRKEAGVGAPGVVPPMR